MTIEELRELLTPEKMHAFWNDKNSQRRIKKYVRDQKGVESLPHKKMAGYIAQNRVCPISCYVGAVSGCAVSTGTAKIDVECSGSVNAFTDELPEWAKLFVNLIDELPTDGVVTPETAEECLEIAVARAERLRLLNNGVRG